MSTTATTALRQRSTSKPDKNYDVFKSTHDNKTQASQPAKAEAVARLSTLRSAATEFEHSNVLTALYVDPECTPWLVFFFVVMFVYAYLTTLGNRTATWTATFLSLALCSLSVSNEVFINFAFASFAARGFMRTLGIALAVDNPMRSKSPYYAYKHMINFNDIFEIRVLSKEFHRASTLTQLRMLAFNGCACACAIFAIVILSTGSLSQGQALTRMSAWPISLPSDFLVAVYEIASTLTNEYSTFIRLVKYVLGFLRFYFVMASVESLYQIHILLLTGCVASCAFVDVFKSNRLSELWGKRWNIPIRNALARAFYSPLKRAGYPLAGKACTFVASSLYHMFLVHHVGVSSRNVACMGMFFMLQIPLIALESRFNLNGQLWFWSSICVGAPLFLEPVAELFGDDN